MRLWHDYCYVYVCMYVCLQFIVPTPLQVLYMFWIDWVFLVTSVYTNYFCNCFFAVLFFAVNGLFLHTLQKYYHKNTFIETLCEKKQSVNISGWKDESIFAVLFLQWVQRKAILCKNTPQKWTKNRDRKNRMCTVSSSFSLQ